MPRCEDSGSPEPSIKSEKVKAKNSKAQKKYRDRKQVSGACRVGSWFTFTHVLEGKKSIDA